MSGPSSEKSVPWSVIQWIIVILAPLVISLGTSYGGYAVQAYRVDAAERTLSDVKAELAAVKAENDSTRSLVREVASDLRLFMCSQDKTFCKSGVKP